jgi:hypothetical protein
MAVKALAAAKHVTGKPMATTSPIPNARSRPPPIWAAIAASSSSCASPAVGEGHELIAEGVLGQMRFANLTFRRPFGGGSATGGAPRATVGSWISEEPIIISTCCFGTSTARLAGKCRPAASHSRFAERHGRCLAAILTFADGSYGVPQCLAGFEHS